MSPRCTGEERTFRVEWATGGDIVPLAMARDLGKIDKVFHAQGVSTQAGWRQIFLRMPRNFDALASNLTLRPMESAKKIAPVCSCPHVICVKTLF